MTTLATLRDRLEVTLQDASNERWSTADLDEAIRQAIEAYSLVDPLEQVTTVTLSSAGREIDISTVSDRLAVTRVWWPYDASAPAFPPKWCTFEVWADASGGANILFIDAESEPAAGDVVRLWYAALHTLSGLDGASSTTLPGDADLVVVRGAAGLAAQARASELAEKLNVDAEVVQRLRDYAGGQLEAFHGLLEARARQMAARHSGVAPGPALDRWDRQSDAQW